MRMEAKPWIDPAVSERYLEACEHATYLPGYLKTYEMLRCLICVQLYVHNISANMQVHLGLSLRSTKCIMRFPTAVTVLDKAHGDDGCNPKARLGALTLAIGAPFHIFYLSSGSIRPPRSKPRKTT